MLQNQIFSLRIVILVIFSKPNQFQMILRPVTLESQIADVLVLNEISRPSKISQLQAPSNFSELHNILKNKNTKMGYSQPQKQNARAWLNKEGVNILPTLDSVKKQKEINLQKQEMKKIEQDCIFYIPDMSYHKIDDYLTKAHQYAKINIYQKNIKNDKFTKKIIQRANLKFSQTTFKSTNLSSERKIRTIATIRTQTRDQNKREKYLNCISNLAKGHLNYSELTYHISSQINSKLWKILAKHIKRLNEVKPIKEGEIQAQLLLVSLKMVEQQFDMNLPRGVESLNDYLTSNYLSKLGGDEVYIKDREHLSFWGKAFLLYRAGRKMDFYKLLAYRNQKEFRKYFAAVDQFIEGKQPESTIPNIQITEKDVFRDQLIHILKREGKYTSIAFSNVKTLDFVWILLRTLGIFYMNEQAKIKFNQNVKSLIKYYNDQRFLTEEQLYNYLYLLEYEELAEMGLVDIMDQDDYIHFLICLNQNKKLMREPQRIRRILSSQLTLYIKQLISLNRLEYVYYTVLYPKQDRITEISSLLSTSNLVSTFNWQFLEASLPTKEEYNQIVKKTLDKYIVNTNDHLLAAQKYQELLGFSEEAIRCLLQFLIKNFYKNSFFDDSVYESEITCERFLYRDKNMETKYRAALKFVIECRQLYELLKDRKDLQIFDLMKRDQFIVLGKELPQKHRAFFDTLIELTSFGVDVYFKFIRNAMRGLEIYYLKRNKNNQLLEFVSKVEDNFEFMMQDQKYAIFKNGEEAKLLKQYLSSNREIIDLGK